MTEILVKQIDGNFLDISYSEKFVEHYNKDNSFSKYIIDNEINNGIYDDVIVELLQKDSVVIDAGANVGLFAAYVLPFCKKIHCVEPTNSHFEVLQDVAKKFPDTFVLHNVALTNYDGVTFFSEVPKNTTENKISREPTATTVTCQTLKTFLEKNNLEEVDLLKMDIEGAEQQIFLEDPTVQEALKKCKCIYLETHEGVVEYAIIAQMVQSGWGHISSRNRTSSHYFFRKENE